MEWDIDTFEREVREHPFFQKLGFTFVNRVVHNLGTDQERYEIILSNSAADRTIEVTFAPPRADGRTAVSQVNIVRTSTDDGFNFKDYLKQYHRINLGHHGSRYVDYSGSFHERVSAYLEFAVGYLDKYLQQTLMGLNWPKVDFDWSGIK
jgi:hypothetical protein